MFDDITSPGEPTHLFLRPGDHPKPGAVISDHARNGNAAFHDISHWAYPALTTESLTC